MKYSAVIMNDELRRMGEVGVDLVPG